MKPTAITPRYDDRVRTALNPAAIAAIPRARPLR
jgi:hypothetical protein